MISDPQACEVANDEYGTGEEPRTRIQYFFDSRLMSGMPDSRQPGLMQPYKGFRMQREAANEPRPAPISGPVR